MASTAIWYTAKNMLKDALTKGWQTTTHILAQAYK
jgi:hypothetical protein